MQIQTRSSIDLESISPLVQRIRETLLRFALILARVAAAGGEKLENSPIFCIAALTLVVLSTAVIKARFEHLTCDEIYTLRIAEQPTVRQMIDVSRRIDLHPPLHYLAERVSLKLPAPRWFSARLPSILATLGTFLLCFAWVRRSLGTLPGFVSACLLWFTPVLSFAWLNRPYALWLFFLSLLAVCWQRAREPRFSLLWTLAVFVACVGMVLDYMAGLFCILPFLAVELRPLLRRNRKSQSEFEIDAAPVRWSLIFALAAPCAASLVYIRQVHDFASNTFAPQYLNWAGTIVDIYLLILIVPLGILTACLLAAWLLTLRAPRSVSSPSRWKPVCTAALAILCLPLLFGALAAARHTQFFTRYGACGALGAVVLCGYLATLTALHPRVVGFLVGLAVLITAILLCQDAPFNPTGAWRAESVKGVPSIAFSQLDPTQPLAIARATDYTEMNERGPDFLLNRTYYLTDESAARQFSGSTVFETLATTAELLHYQTRTTPLHDFLAQHRSFYLIADYTDPEEWLPRYLIASGAHLRYLGKLSSDYRDNDLYVVTVP